MRDIKTLIIFCSWGANESFYESLVKTSPNSWQILFMPYHQHAKTGHLNDWNDQALKFFRDKNLDKVNLLGHSLGGALAIKFTAEHPDKVAKLYLVDSEGIFSNDNYIQLLINASVSNSTYFGSHPIQFLKFIARGLKRPFWNKRQVDFANKADLINEASQIKAPTTIFWGGKDKLTPLWQGHKLNQLIKHSKLILFEGLSHDWILNKPELFWKAVSLDYPNNLNTRCAGIGRLR